MEYIYIVEEDYSGEGSTFLTCFRNEEDAIRHFKSICNEMELHKSENSFGNGINSYYVDDYVYVCIRTEELK